MNKTLNNSHPFSNHNFIELLETSKSVGNEAGWIPHHFKNDQSVLPSYIKLHSHGEYIFDWNWANFYHQNKINYYPKLLHAIPFTPVNAPKIIGRFDDFELLSSESFKFYQEHNLSSEHYLFINDNEEKVLSELGFTTKLTHQYHFYNSYDSFDEFLSKLKKNKRKNIKKERKAISNSDLKIKTIKAKEMTSEILDQLHFLYLSTIHKKGSYAYLTKDFFLNLACQQSLIICAYKNDSPIAMALFFYNDKALYGRNWGIHPKEEENYPYLHFELCYYQGIEFCIENKIEVFEAGARLT